MAPLNTFPPPGGNLSTSASHSWQESRQSRCPMTLSPRTLKASALYYNKRSTNQHLTIMAVIKQLNQQ